MTGNAVAIVDARWHRPRSSAVGAASRLPPRRCSRPAPGGADIPTMAVPSTDPGSEYPDDPYYWEPRRRVLPWVAAVVVVGLITGGIILAAGSGDGGVGSGHDGPIAMPSVVTDQLSEALSILEREGRRRQGGDGHARAAAEHGPRHRVRAGSATRYQRVRRACGSRFRRAPDKMPDFVGRGVNAARATLTTLDVKVTIQDLARPDPHRRNGVGTDAPEGCPLRERGAAHGSAQADSHQPRRPHRHRDRADRDGRDDRGNRVPAQPRVGHVGVPRGATAGRRPTRSTAHYRKLLATAGLGPDSQDPRRPACTSTSPSTERSC